MEQAARASALAACSASQPGILGPAKCLGWACGTGAELDTAPTRADIECGLIADGDPISDGGLIANGGHGMEGYLPAC